MTPFIAGFLSCWILFSAIQLVAERFDWYYSDSYFYLVAAPIMIPVLVFGTLGLLLIKPWHNVIHPVERDRFDRMCKISKGKQHRITKRFYLCTEWSARLVNKVFLVRIKKEVTGNGFSKTS